jgi:hypothetical protein
MGLKSKMDLVPSFLGIRTMLVKFSQWKFSKWRMDNSLMTFMRSSLMVPRQTLKNNLVNLSGNKVSFSSIFYFHFFSKLNHYWPKRWFACDWRCLATQLGTPRGRYDEHSDKFPSIWNQGLIEPVGERNHFRRLMPASLAMLQTICLWRLSRRISAPAATWNLHTTQPKYFAPTISEVVNLTSLL